MCGIFGHTHRKPDLAHSRAALQSLTHRGPDQWGEYTNDHIYIGHRRLAVLDTSENAKQPITDRHITIAVNGEIYNYKDLANSFHMKHHFKTTSDSEVLLYAYKEWGIEKLIDKLEGMFALAIYDEQSQKLHIARDHYGIKPLYYSTQNGFAFASEIKALFHHNPDLRRFSMAGVGDWLHRRGSWSGKTPYAGVMKLLPGYRIEIDVKTGSYKIIQYYDLLDDIAEPSEPADLEDILSQSVRSHLMSNVPLGLQLSGGIDSSLIAHTMREHIKSPIHSFSIGFADPAEKHLSEEPYARQVAGQLGLTHHQINITQKDITNNFAHVLWLCDGLLDFPNTIAIYLLAKFSKEFVTVQLTGEGADELFGGYNKFSRMLGLSKRQFIRPWGRAGYLNKMYGGNPQAIFNDLNSYLPAANIITGVNNNDITSEVVGEKNRRKFESLSFAKQMLVLDHKTYLHAVLERQDRGSMGASIESRVPFVDRNLIRWAINIPDEYLFDRRQTKKILKQKAASIFGHEFAYRKKVGFPLPIQNWMQDSYHAQNDNSFFAEGFKKARAHSGYKRNLLNYPDPQSQWIDWFGFVLASTQEQLNITDVRA